MRTLGDRRSAARLEILGVLWGTLEVMERTRLVDISEHGALISSAVPLLYDSVQPVQVTLEGSAVVIDARVCHVRCVSGSNEPREYLIGFEFLAALNTVGTVSG